MSPAPLGPVNFTLSALQRPGLCAFKVWIQASAWCCKSEPCAITPRSFPSSLWTSHLWHNAPSGHPRSATGESLGGRFNLVGNSSPRPTPTHRRTHSPASRGRQGQRSQGMNQSPLQAPQRHAPPCPRSEGRSPYIKQRHPPRWNSDCLEVGRCAPSSRWHILGTPHPTGGLNPDTMYSVRPLQLVVLPLLLVGTALGDAPQAPPGISLPRGPPYRPGQAARAPRTPALALCAPLSPIPAVHHATGHLHPSLHFLSLQMPFCCAGKLPGQNSPGSFSLRGDVADLLLSLSGSPSAPPVGNNAEICLLPPDEGPCRARIPSYYYDRYTQSCREFMYGGCEGNANNFETWEACDEACWRIQSKCSHAHSGLLCCSLHWRASSNLAYFPDPIFYSKF